MSPCTGYADILSLVQRKQSLFFEIQDEMFKELEKLREQMKTWSNQPKKRMQE